MPSDSSVLMVVVMKDGALIGSEVFPSGTYRMGRADDMDLRLDDARIADHHASFLFINGQVGIRDEGSEHGIFVNGEKVKSARVQPRDEVEISPFVLKMRLVGKRREDGVADPAGRAASSQELPAAAFPVDVADEPTVLAPLPSPPASQPRASMRAVPAARPESAPAARSGQRAGVSSLLQPRPIPRSVSGAAAETAPAPAPSPALASVPSPAPEPPKQQRHQTVTVRRARPGERSRRSDRPVKAARPIPRPIPPPSDSEIKAGKVLTKPVLRVQVLWGEVEHAAIVGTRTFEPGQGVMAGPSDEAPVPLYGFPNKGRRNLRLAQYRGGKWRVMIPAGVELLVRSGASYARQATPADGGFELSEQESVVLRAGSVAVELISELANARVPVSFKPKIERSYWIPLLSAVVAIASLVAYSRNLKDIPDFVAKPLPERARLILTPKKKKEQPKLVEKKEEKIVEKKPDPKQQPKPPKEIPVQRQPAVAAVTKLLNQTKVTQKLFAAVNNIGAKGKLGNGMDFKATGLIGKLPLAMMGGNSVGLGKGFGGGGTGGVGYATMRGAGILGKGNIGKRGVVGAPVTTPRGGQKVSGELPMDAVRKVVEAHMGAIQRCYEGALIRNPSIAGKVTFEWTIGTDGSVTTAKTKVSTLPSNEVVDCIRSSLVTWRFPQPKGGVVVVSYPFLFNSVGN